MADMNIYLFLMLLALLVTFSGSLFHFVFKQIDKYLNRSLNGVSALTLRSEKRKRRTPIYVNRKEKQQEVEELKKVLYEYFVSVDKKINENKTKIIDLEKRMCKLHQNVNAFRIIKKNEDNVVTMKGKGLNAEKEDEQE